MLSVETKVFKTTITDGSKWIVRIDLCGANNDEIIHIVSYSTDTQEQALVVEATAKRIINRQINALKTALDGLPDELNSL